MIESVDQLERWFAFAVTYARKTPGNARRAFDTAAAAEDPAFTPAFTDDALILFDEVVADPPAPPVKKAAGRG